MARKRDRLSHALLSSFLKEGARSTELIDGIMPGGYWCGSLGVGPKVTGGD
jgi:hypothetical protein